MSSSTEFLHVRVPCALSDKYLCSHKVVVSNTVLWSHVTRDPETVPLTLVNSVDISMVSRLRVPSSLIFLAFLSWLKYDCNSVKHYTVFQ